MTGARGWQADSVLRTRFWIEVALAAVAVVLTVTTAIVPDWIERLTGAHPDSGGGELEWMFAFIPAAAALGLGYASRREWRRAVPVCPGLRAIPASLRATRNTGRRRATAGIGKAPDGPFTHRSDGSCGVLAARRSLR